MEFIFATNMDQVIAEAIMLDDAQVDTLTEVGGMPVAADGAGDGTTPRLRPDFPAADESFGDNLAADAAVRRKRGR
jgi:hypothetical protein